MARKHYPSDQNRTHRRRAYARIPTSILREPWPRDVKFTVVFLQLYLVDRWARDGLTPEQACRAVLDPPAMMMVTGKNSVTAAAQALQALSEHVSIEVDIPGIDGCVYFGLGADGRCKIGQTVDAERRARQLGIEILTTIPSLNPRRLERQMHRRFGALREEGEWFRFEGDLVRYLEDAKAAMGGAWAGRGTAMGGAWAGRGRGTATPRHGHANVMAEIYWPKFADFQELPGRERAESATAKGQSSPAPSPAPSPTQQDSVASAPEGSGGIESADQKPKKKCSDEAKVVVDLWISLLESECDRPPPLRRASWYDEARKLTTLDGCSVEEFERIVRWLTSDANEKSDYPFVCYSVKNLRRDKCDKLERIRARMRKGTNGSGKPDPGQASNERLKKRMERQGRDQDRLENRGGEEADRLF